MDANRLPAASAWPDAVFDDLVCEARLERLQIYSSGKAVKERRIAAGNFGVPRGESDMLDLGPAIDVLILARRAKALDTSDPNGAVTVFDPSDSAFRRIRRDAESPDSGAMYGVSFLVFERSSRDLYELFLGTRSTRPVAKTLFPYLPLTAAEAEAKGLRAKPRGPTPVTLVAVPIVTPNYSWFVPEVKPCAEAIEGLPPTSQLVAEVMAFLHPQS
jgi:hypothetical protein